MKLNYTLSEVASIINSGNDVADNQIVRTIYYDTRKIYTPEKGLFICLRGERRDGHDYIKEAYRKGIRLFIIENDYHKDIPDGASIIRVENSLLALQQLAQYHRSQYSYPVIGITGSTGKTTLKEWLYELLRNDYKIVRSPKSFNSQLGAALSLLEMSDTFNLAIIEAGISKPGEMAHLQKMIQPTIGVLTNIGSAHLQHFQSKDEIFHEKSILFKDAEVVFSGDTKYTLNTDLSDVDIDEKQLSQWTKTYFGLLQLASKIVVHLTGKLPATSAINHLPQLAMRMEVFEGIQNNTIINDAYNLDLDALKQSLDFLVTSSNRSHTAVLVVANEIDDNEQKMVEQLVRSYPIDDYRLVRNIERFDVHSFTDTTILIKGYRSSNGQKLAQYFKLMKHETVVEIDMDALRNNLNFVRSKVKPTTKILAMVKASAYGTDALKIAPFLERNNVDYLGVAYGDEGVSLRKIGVKTPILVMNVEPFAYEDIIHHQLEPAIYSRKSLDEFIKTLINLGIENYPIHLTFDTGMHRLGFNPDEVERVLETVLAQPEIHVKGIYTHLADADNHQSDEYSLQQLNQFEKIVATFKEKLSYPIIAHALNSEGIMKFPEHQFDMVRIGIALYGSISHPELKENIHPVISWKTIISQIRELPKGEKVSYNGRFTTQRTSKIAVIPVGYADGLKRSYNQNGEGFVYVNGIKCAIVGNICMDMCMIDVTDVKCEENDDVIIIGKEQSLEEVAKQMQTISYEVLTSISKRVHRVYLNER